MPTPSRPRSHTLESPMALRRIAALVLTAATCAITPAIGAPTAGAVTPSEQHRLMPVPLSHGGDRLTVTVRDSGSTAMDGTHELKCHPTGGDHPKAQDACRALDKATRWGKDPFAPVAPDAVCTMQHGGPATAHVTGRWAGRPVDATFKRDNGCEIGRWDKLVPLLPSTAS
ncbi:SSI family serine proteinase inhibitor [Streptomyces violens]|uniref:SSI family serine proteinase inhibitor n=1 Tax=Streptomyces violens TaxID=66377 RepID=UPI001FE17B32|nr:SSI family serine proteinase inhibitor [Streptomyces violens]